MTFRRRESATILFRELLQTLNPSAFYGGIHGMKFGFHFVLVNRFPWAIYYQMEDGLPVVFRILDCRSTPDSHLKALTEE